MEFLTSISPREYQQKIFETCKDKNCLVVLPTGLGKTLIALMLTIERMKSFPGEKVLFLAPTRPLAEQHIIFFKKHLPELFGDMQLFTGTVKAEKRKQIWKTADIIFSTPQCIANDLRHGHYNLNDVCLLVEDEAHRCMKNYDYTEVAKKYKSQSVHQRILGLTASPGSDSDKIKEICSHLSIEAVELRTRESEDVKENLQERDFEKIQMDLPPEFIEIKEVLKRLYNSYIEILKMSNLLFGPATKINLIKLQGRLAKQLTGGNRHFSLFRGISACASAIKIQHGMELIETQTVSGFIEYMKSLIQKAEKSKSKGAKDLVNKPEFILALKKSEELLSKEIEHPKVQTVVEIIKKEHQENQQSKVIVFSQYRDTASLLSKRLSSLDEITAKVFVGQLKKKDLGLSQKEQKETIREFSDGEINVLCATSIGEEGLDIPEVSLVVFYEPVPSAIRAIQRAGRTARLNRGKLIMLITQKTKDEISYYSSRRREKKMGSAIEDIKKELSSGGLEFQKTL